MKNITFFLNFVCFLLFFKTSQAQNSWPGEAWQSSVNLTSLDVNFNINMSGQFWNPVKRELWVVSNSGYFWKLKEGGSLGFMIDSTGGIAKWIPGGDLEDITQANLNDNTVFTMNESGYIQEFDVSVHGVNNNIHTWNIIAQAGPDLYNGPEGIAFIPDEWLSYNGFVDQNNNPYTSVNGMGGLMFVAHQTGGYIYVFDLKRSDNTYIFVGKYASGYSESSGLSFDRSIGKLFIWHNTGSNYIEVTELKSYNLGGGIRKFYKQASFFGPKTGNLEGIACTPAFSGEDWYFATDDDNQDGYAVYWFNSFDPCVFEPFFKTDKTTACIGENIVISDTSIGICGTETFLWNFGTNAFPATATGIGPHTISYSSSGAKNIKLKITGLYSDSLVKNSYITINDLPNINANPADTTICAGTSITLIGSGASFYTWTNNVTDGVGFIPSTTLSYTVIGTDTNNCSDSATATIHVSPLPTVSLSAFNPETVCITTEAFALSGGLPANGVYSGNGVSSEIFNPSIAGIGSNTITYAYSDSSGCSNSASQTIYVELCTGIMVQNLHAGFSIYPNPNTGIFEILLQSDAASPEVEIFNLQGKKIYITNLHQHASNIINLSKFQKGIYFIKINNGEKNYIEKIVIQ